MFDKSVCLTQGRDGFADVGSWLGRSVGGLCYTRIIGKILASRAA